MASRARRGARDTERSSRAGSSLALIEAASAVASGSAIATRTPVTPPATSELPTRATYRNLIMRGLEPDEAANLTAYLAGIAVGDTHWTIRQVNQLLFLRQMQRTGHFREAEESPQH